MKKDYPVIKQIALAVSALLMSSMVNAADETPAAGVVVMAVGKVTVTGGAGGERPLQRRSNIFAGETIITGKDSRAQVRLSDGSLVSLQGGSQFRIESYSYQQEKKGDNATYKLLKGGMRTISGAVGKTNRDAYKVETPVATIGIRGTDYELMLHDSDNSGADELYGYINDGTINAANKAGKRNFSDNEFFEIVGPDMPPQSLLKPPGFMFEGYVPESTAENKDVAEIFPLDPSLVDILTSTETSDLLNSTINPMLTPFATVTQLTGYASYGIPPGGATATDQNGQVASSLIGMASVDFDLQVISSIWFSTDFPNGKSILLSSSVHAPISSVIGQGEAILLTGTCEGGECPPPLVAGPLPMTGSATVQFVGPNAEGIASTFSAQDDVTGTQTISGSALFTQDGTAYY